MKRICRKEMATDKLKGKKKKWNKFENTNWLDLTEAQGMISYQLLDFNKSVTPISKTLNTDIWKNEIRCYLYTAV